MKKLNKEDLVMKKEGRKMTWAIGLIAGLGVLSIAYAALSSTLQINGDTTKINTHGVEFVKGKGYAIGDDTKIDEGGNVTPAITDESKFNEAPANALAKLGTCEIGTLSESDLNGLATNGTAGVNRVRNNDKMIIKGTELYEWGSYVVYKLDLQNFASNNMKLTSAPDVTVSTSDDLTPNERVEVKLYSDSTCKNELAAWQDGDATTGNDKGNWLAKATTADAGGAKTDGGTTSWYVKVYYNQYSKGASPAWELKDGTFTFTVAPVWEAA